MSSGLPAMPEDHSGQGAGQGCLGGGVGIAAAVDHCFATIHAAIKLSELAVGTGPFVVGPVIERKIGNAAFRQLALRAGDRLQCRIGLRPGPLPGSPSPIWMSWTAVQQFAHQKLATYNP